LFVFFYSIENKITKKYNQLFRGGGKGSGRLSGQSWNIMKYDIAESGVFNKRGLTPYESVNRENLHDVLRYANVRAVQLDEHNRDVKRKNKKP